MDYPAEFVEPLVGLSRSLAGIALQRVADLAVEQLNGCDIAGVTLGGDGQPTTAVFTEQAFDMLKRASQHTNRKVRDVAAVIVNDAITGGKRTKTA